MLTEHVWLSFENCSLFSLFCIATTLTVIFSEVNLYLSHLHLYTGHNLLSD
jgi:hypothetical protein